MEFLTLFISLRCTQACAHCLYGCSPKYGEHMPWHVFKQSVLIAEESKINSLNFFGGEPLLNPQFFPMLQTALERKFFLILATNCRPLTKKAYLTRFLDITKKYKDRIVVVTARDKFHLRYFDPAETIDHLLNEGYKVTVNKYSDHSVLLSEYNAINQELRKIDTHFSCCNGLWTDNLGILPDGRWTICPASLETFGSIFTNSLAEILQFKSGLSLRYKKGCTECLKDFKDFRKIFEINRDSKNI